MTVDTMDGYSVAQFDAAYPAYLSLDNLNNRQILGKL